MPARKKRSRQQKNKSTLNFDTLEPRQLLAADLSLNWDALTTQPLVGETVNVSVSVTNSGDATGYGPFIDVLVPGGDAANDGLTYVNGSASLLGAGLNETIVQFNADGQAEHPFAKDADGRPVVLEGSPEDQLVVFELPVGSFTQDQPTMQVDLQLAVDGEADFGETLAVVATGGLRYGNDPLDNPTIDPVVFSDQAVLEITPEIIRAEIQYLGPENETATGESFVRSYRVSFDLVEGVNVNDFRLTTAFDSNEIFLGLRELSSGNQSLSVVEQPVIGQHSSNRLVLSAENWMGGEGIDGSFIVDVFVPESDANGDYVIDPVNAQDSVSTIEAFVSGNWIRETATADQAADLIPFQTVPVLHELKAEYLAVQQNVSIVGDHNEASLSVGDLLKFDINFQISDYAVLDDLTLQLTVPDGQLLDESRSATLLLSGVAQADGASNTFAITLEKSNDWQLGQQIYIANISQTLLSMGLSPRLHGASTAGGQGPVVGTVTYYANVQDEFRGDVASGDVSIDERDRFQSDVIASATNIDPVSGQSTGYATFDDSGTTQTLKVSPIKTSVFSINGQQDFDDVAVTADDLVTYRITRDVRGSDIENLVISEYFPLPVFTVNELHWADGDLNALAENSIQLGPNDSLHQLFDIQPDINVDSANNSFSLNYGDLDSAANETTTIDLLVTVRVQDNPFADGLWLSSLANSKQSSSNNGGYASSALASIRYTRPVLTILKSAVGSDNDAASLVSAGDGGTDIRGVDAGDLVRFEIAIENKGLSQGGAHDVWLTDSLPTGFDVPESGLNLRVVDGQGNEVDYRGAASGADTDLFASGLELLSPIGSVADSTGGNRVVISYELQVFEESSANQVMSSTASIGHYAAVAGGENYVTSPIEDDAKVETADVTIEHRVVATDQSSTTGKDVVIGETVTYTAIVRIPEGGMDDAVLQLNAPRGLAFNELIGVSISDAIDVVGHDADSIFEGAGISDRGNNIRNGGRILTIEVGDLVNTNRDNSVDETIEVTYTATVTNDPSNDVGDRRRNNAVWSHSAGVRSSASDAVTIAEPNLSVRHSWSAGNADAGDTLTVSMEISPNQRFDATAFDVQLQGSLPQGVTYVQGSLRLASGLAPSVSSEAPDQNGFFHASWDAFSADQTSVLQYDVVVDNDIQVGSELKSDVVIQWSSLSGQPGQIADSNDLTFERTGDSSDVGGTANDYKTQFVSTIYVNSAVVSGSVFVDANQDGVEQFGDRGLGDVGVTLTGVDHLGQSVYRETKTAATGKYEFLGLRPGVYSVIQTQPESVFDGLDFAGTLGGIVGEDRIDSIQFPTGQTDVSLNNNFTESPLSWIEGTVFVDENADGKLGHDEAGIESVTIQLSGVDDAGNFVSQEVQTNDRGHYVFGYLNPGTYTLLEGQTVGYFDADEQLGSRGGEVGNDVFSGIKIAAGEPGKMYNFGEYEPAEISGRVYIDYDRDSVLDRKDGLITGVTVELAGENDLGEIVQLVTQTNVDGYYVFENLRPGEYRISSEAIEGLEDSVSNVGQFLGEYGPTFGNGVPVANGFESIQLPAGVVALGYNLGHVDPSFETTLMGTDFETQHAILGSNASDQFVVEVSTEGASFVVDGNEYHFDSSQKRSFRVLGSFGDDSLTFTGSENKETIDLRKHSARITGTWFETLVYGMEEIQFVGGGNEDLARFYDTTGDDTFDGGPFLATMSGTGYLNSVDEVHRIYAYMTEGFDQVSLSGQAGQRDNFVAKPDRGKLYSNEFYLYAENYDTIDASATDDLDRAYLFGSANDDTLRSSDDAVSLSSDGYTIDTDGYRYVTVSAKEGGTDQALLVGSTGNDQFTSRPSKAVFDYAANRLIAKDFEVVQVQSGGGSDTARVFDSHHEDLFVADVDQSRISNAINETTMIGFSRVNAYMDAGGDDVAVVAGSNDADVFKASPTKWTMASNRGTYLWGRGFTSVVASGQANDKAYLYDSSYDDTLRLTATSATLEGQRFSNSALGFGKVNSEASGGNDRVVFLDSDARSTVRVNESKTTIFGSGFSYNATGFDAVDAYFENLNGRDNVDLSGRIGFDMSEVDLEFATYKLSFAIDEDLAEINLKSKVASLH